MSRFCTVCGAALEDNAGFCGNCGTPVQQAQPPVEYRQPDAREPYPEQPGYLPAEQSYQPLQQPARQYHCATPVNADAHPYPYTTPNAPGASDSRSHLGIGVGVTIGIVLLIAAVITAVVLTVFVWKPWEKSADDPQAVLEMLGDYELGSLGEEEYLDLYYEYHYASAGEKRTQLRSLLVNPMEDTRKEYREVFGEDVAITMTVTSKITLDGAERQKIVDYVGQYADTSKIDEIVRVFGTAKWEGSRASETNEFFNGDGIIFIKAEGKWYASACIFENIRFVRLDDN